VTSTDGRTASIEKMRAEGVAEQAIATFADFYDRLRAGEQGLMPEDEIEPVDEVPEFDALPELDDAGREALDRTVVLKLNGGLGTSMGMTKAKSLLEVKDGLTFLDVIARQVLDLRRRHDARIPLVLMNSFRTRDDTLAALERYADLAADVPVDFVQGKVPKIGADDLQPIAWPDDPELEWAPPGHGDLYTALGTSGMLDALLEAGYERAFVANSDNLGAVLEPRIAAWMAREQVPFVMEVCDRTEADKKGGHLARRPGGALLLREVAQTPEDDLGAFQDTGRHRFFNTNNLWVDLRVLAEVVRERDGVLGLPMIVNRKTVDPSDKSSPAVIQLESAMGAAVAVFDGARALRVPRSRFLPVKTTDDLLVLRSDAYVLDDASRVRLAPERSDGAPLVDLDDAYFKVLRDFDARFPAGAPSLVACERLAVSGDVTFGRGVVVSGTVAVEGPARIEDGTVLEG